MTPVRIGLAGYGRGGRYFHAPLIGLAPECALAAVVTHEALVREVIALGLPVVCDKPFTPDAPSARALIEAAERSGVLLAVYQNRRWDADFLTVRALVASGTFAVEPDDGQAGWLLSGRSAGDEEFGAVPPSCWGRIYRGEDAEPEPVPAERGRWSAFYSAFARAVRGEGPLPVDPRDAVAALEVLDAARLSAARGEVVRLST